MTLFKLRLASITLLLTAAALPAFAESSVSSAASDSASTSVGSSSTSIGKSSDSSSGKNDKVAAGDYQIIEVADAPARPGTVRLKLQGTRPTEGEFFLYMPQQAFDESRLATGHVVTAKPRPYGMEFARSQTREAFFLVLEDEWFRELNTRVVTL